MGQMQREGRGREMQKGGGGGMCKVPEAWGSGEGGEDKSKCSQACLPGHLLSAHRQPLGSRSHRL